MLGRRTWAALLGQSQTRTKPAEHRVGVVNDCFHARSEPKLMILACADAGFRSFRLEWGEWSARHAIGRGVFRFNDCDPACVVGTLHRRVGRIVLREPQFCKSLDRRVFMSGRVIFDRPFKGDRGNPIGPGCPSK